MSRSLPAAAEPPVRHEPGARIGPNAIIQTAAALEAVAGAETCAAIFRSAGLERHLDVQPTAMVGEPEVERLFQALESGLGADRAAAIAADAGHRTGAYILAHRIPKPAKVVLGALPPPLACRLLLRAIAAHAWTFVGSGRFASEPGNPTRILITDSPICAAAPSAGRSYYVSTFAHLFQALVSARSTTTPGAPAGPTTCTFAIGW